VSDDKQPRSESLWLFGEPEPAAAAVDADAPPPVRKARRTKAAAPRQIARPSRDLFTAVGNTFARSSEAARSEPAEAEVRRAPVLADSAPAEPAARRKPRRAEAVPADSAPAPVPTDISPEIAPARRKPRRAEAPASEATVVDLRPTPAADPLLDAEALRREAEAAVLADLAVETRRRQLEPATLVDPSPPPRQAEPVLADTSSTDADALRREAEATVLADLAAEMRRRQVESTALADLSPSPPAPGDTPSTDTDALRREAEASVLADLAAEMRRRRVEPTPVDLSIESGPARGEPQPATSDLSIGTGTVGAPLRVEPFTPSGEPSLARLGAARDSEPVDTDALRREAEAAVLADLLRLRTATPGGDELDPSVLADMLRRDPERARAEPPAPHREAASARTEPVTPEPAVTPAAERPAKSRSKKRRAADLTVVPADPAPVADAPVPQDIIAAPVPSDTHDLGSARAPSRDDALAAAAPDLVEIARDDAPPAEPWNRRTPAPAVVRYEDAPATEADVLADMWRDDVRMDIPVRRRPVGDGPRRQEVLAVIAEAELIAESAFALSFDRPLAGGHQLTHMRILASAGSGKTYQLTNRYLQVLSRGAFPYSILASTFTRAAAGEIRDRILRTLAEAADDESKRDELCRRIHQQLTRARVLDLLASLANNLHRLQIRTLDSFFGTIVRCFSLELGLPTDARIADEDEAFRLRRESIGRMLEEGDTEEVIELLASLTEGSSERAVTDTIDNTVSSLYDLYREAHSTSAWDAIPPEPTLGEAELDAAIVALRAAVPADLGKRGVEAHAKDCQRAELCRTGASDDWMEFFTSGLAAKVADGSFAYYGKPLPGDTIAAYQRLLRHARAVFRKRVIDQTRATHQLLALFDSCYRRVKREHKVLTFADLTVALAQADLAGKLDEICFRIDARLRHILLDEMQDTSIQQWNALRPIVDETVSYSPDERSFFCVGDVKQSIYGWRNACPEILSRLDDLLDRPGGAVLHKESLATSFRSSQQVIDVVNKIFTNLSGNPALLRYPDAARRWDDEFEQHRTTRDLPGYVQLRAVARCEDQGKRQALRLQEAAALVAELYHRHPGKTIGVLLRTNGAVGRVLYELGPTRLKIPATGRGGGPLTDAPAVNALLDVLRTADHPDDTIAAFNVMSSPLGPVVGLVDDHPGRRHRVAARVRRQIASDGLAPTLQQWIRAIASQVDERQYRRCMQLIQLAQTWDERRSLRCDDFVAMVETRPVADPAASAVQVMTVHQSKGLEFDIVILPELENELASTRTLKVVYQRDGDAGPVVRIARHVSKDMWQQFDDLRPIFEQHIGRLAHETLCLLYVAVTRAREGLFMLVDPPSENSRGAPAKMSALLLAALHEGPVEPDSVVYEHGDPRWLAPHPYQPQQAPDPSDPHLDAPLEFLPSEGPLVRSAGALTSDSGRTVGDLMQLTDTPMNTWAAAQRALFAEVEWLEEFRPTTPQLEAVVRAAAPTRDEEWVRARVQEFLRLLGERPGLRAALSRGGRDPAGLRVERQVPFARLEGGALQTGEIARLVQELDMSHGAGPEAPVRKATIYGLCLDNVDTAAAAEDRARQYKEAVSAWRAAAAEQAGLDKKQVDAVLLFPAADVALAV
jgi:ATP-dependent helicase/nuclease subunit A